MGAHRRIGMKSDPQFDVPYIHILDGGMATELERRGHNISGPLWSARVLNEAPDAIRQVHLDYLRAGADCISTASYQVSAMGYAELGRPREEAARALRKSVEIAQQARDEYRRESDRPVLIAASLGPYGAALHNGAEFHGRYEIGFNELVAFHAERLAIAAETGADLVALETIPSLEEARAVLAALERFPQLWAWLSFTCRDAEHVAHGEKLSDCARLLDEAQQVVGVGVNCTHPRFVAGLIAAAKSTTGKPIFVYPNSGETWDAVHRHWAGKSDLEEYEKLAAKWFQAGAHAVGGCCRTTPEHIQAVQRVWQATHPATMRQ